MGLLANFCGCLWRRMRGGGAANRASGEDGEEDSPDLFYKFQTLQLATDFFSELNLLGRGGFGPVYKVLPPIQEYIDAISWLNLNTSVKGLMPNGQEVAVKKLSMNSRQGVKEFTNEVKLLLRIQHKNLVTLLGCCVEGPEKMLVYEYLPNKSLDRFLFDTNKSRVLDWRCRFRIIMGVARGLLYLHEEAPERIIHRDIKASNILLDEQLNPKISDFGLARLFPGEDTHLETFKIAGTHGYMAPEYVLRGYLSVKSDVFSFGVLILEIVSGRRNHDTKLGAEKADLLSYSWKLFQAGKSLELVDSTLVKCNPDEAAMCIQLGLLCCQAFVPERPDMSSAHLMLSNDSFTLPRPQKPGIQGRIGEYTTTTSAAFTNNTNATTTSTHTGVTKASTGSSLVEDFSRNSISYSSLEEGR